jgi:predicted RNA-binding Zn ribbon-like protein
MDLLFVDLVNSEWYDGHGNREDRLLQERWRAEFLARWGLGRYGPLDRQAVSDLGRLRAALRDLTERLARGARPTARQLAELNAALAQAPVRFELRSTGTGYAVEPVPAGRGHPRQQLLAEVARSAAGFLASEDLGRLKVCDNPGCRWAFYDESRNRSRRWCQSTACGNRFKVRRFRERQRRRP